MINKALEEEIIKYCLRTNGIINKYAINRLPEEYKTYLNNRFEYIESYEEAIFRLRNNIEIRPICEICGGIVSFYGKIRRPYSLCCCEDHAKELNKIHRYKTNLEKYGVENASKSDIIKQKQSIIYHEKEEQIKETRKNTLKEKYGVENSFQLEISKEKSKQTCLEKYGAENAAQSEIVQKKIKQTCLEKYGVENATQVKEVKDKIKQTCLEKYGVDNAAKCPEIQDKINNTKTKNGTHNTSIPENKSYILLKEKYYNVVRQYKSKVYPFNCDFYIPNLDLYIECNYSWLHGFHPFNENNKEDINKLNKWKKHNTTFYNSAIKVWTISDIKKRNTAKENKLNWIEFFNINELEKWLNNN